MAIALAGSCQAQLSRPATAPAGRAVSSLPPQAGQIIGVPSTMLPVNQNSRSLILRASHILSVGIENVQASPWTPRAGGGEERKLALTVRLDRVFKGHVDQPAGAVVRFDAVQRRLGMGWGRMPGVWSNVNVEPGTRLIAFAGSSVHDAALLLTDPAAVELLPAEDARVDVEAAARMSAMALADVLAAARQQAPALRNLFGDYLWASYRAAAMKDFAEFELIAMAVEWAELNTVARATLLMSIPDDVLAVEPPATRHIDRLAAAMVRVLQLPQAQALHDNILGTFLPNLVDAQSADSRPPVRVFADYPAELAGLRRLLAASERDPEAAVLLAWAKR